jgi:chorismate mutase
VGARTTVNPFSVQEIADACKGSELAIFVKNPIHADVDLWQGSIERFYNNGIENLAAIHRGFSSFINSEYRNLPNWKIPIELQRRLPELPIICDPSHIAGSRDLLPLVAQKALDINMAGLMVEVHPNPDKALSDPQQQLPPESYINMVQNLQVRQEQAFSPELMDRLEELRGHIDKIDEDLITTLASRLELIKEIGEHKLSNNIAVFQLERWNQILNTRILLAEKLGLEYDFIKKMMELIHNESIRLQSDINNSLKENP